MLQLTHPKVAQPKLVGGLSVSNLPLISIPHPTRMPDSPAKRPGKYVFVAASHQTGLDTRSKARRPIKVGIRGREGRERAETRTLLVIDPLSALRWVWKAACPPEGGPTEVGGFSASNLPLVSIPHPTWMPDGPAKRPGKYPARTGIMSPWWVK